MGTDDEVLTFEKPPGEEGQSDGAPIEDVQPLGGHSTDQLFEQREERGFDRESRRPHDTEESVNDGQGVEELGQLVRLDNDARVGGQSLIDEHDLVKMHDQTRSGAEADHRET